MQARIGSLSPRTLLILGIGAVVLYAGAVWFLMVSPKRSEAASVGAEIAEAELRLAELEAPASRPQEGGAPVADVFRLAKAMPSSTDQPGLVLEISKLATSSGVTLRSITPQAPVAAVGGPTLIPLTVTVGGSYLEITKFLRRTRGLVTVRRGKIHASGRLLMVQSVALVESVTAGFPQLDATVALNAYVYDGPIEPADMPEAPAEELEPTGGSAAAGSTH